MENGGLPLKTKDRAIDIRLIQKNASIVDQITRGEIIGTVDDDVVFAEQIESIVAGQARLVSIDANLRIHAGQAFLGSLNLGPADVAGRKRNLALEIGEVDHVKIDDAQPPDSSRGEIESKRRTETTRADHEHLCLSELELPLHANFGHDQVAAVALNLLL